MNRFVLFPGVGVAIGLCLLGIGCGEKTRTGITGEELRQALEAVAEAPGGPQLMETIAQTRAHLQANEYDLAASVLVEQMQAPGLTAQQQAALRDAFAAVQQRLIARAKHGDVEASGQLEAIRKLVRP